MGTVPFYPTSLVGTVPLCAWTVRGQSPRGHQPDNLGTVPARAPAAKPIAAARLRRWRDTGVRRAAAGPIRAGHAARHGPCATPGQSRGRRPAHRRTSPSESLCRLLSNGPGHRPAAPQQREGHTLQRLLPVRRRAAEAAPTGERRTSAPSASRAPGTRAAAARACGGRIRRTL